MAYLLLYSTVEHLLGEGVARRGGLQRVSKARPMEVRSDRTPQPTRERKGFWLMRLDLYLKLSRLVPRRTGAKELCDAGEVSVNGLAAKAGRDVHPGDRVTVLLTTREITVEVLDLPAGRSVAKAAARELFRVIGERRFDLLGNELPPR